MAEKLVYDFEEIDYTLKNLVGGKGAGLGEMTRRGFPVPPGFTIITSAEKIVKEQGYKAIKNEIEEAVQRLEDKTQKKFGRGKDPLLVSVRSGAVISMPGIMETILNVGANHRFTERRDSFYTEVYFNLLKSFATNVFHLDDTLVKKRKFMDVYGKRYETLKEGMRKAGYRLPQDPQEQLQLAIEAVFNSWHSQKAKDYREVEKIPEDIGTAVNVQSMVYGNRDAKSFTAVFFTRNPSNGSKGITGSFKQQAQGDALVNGESGKKLDVLNPQDRKTLDDLAMRLESEFQDMQEVEVTKERDRMYVLQTRAGKRTIGAELSILLDMHDEGKISKQNLLTRIKPKTLSDLNLIQIDPSEEYQSLGKGTQVCPGLVNGYVAFNHSQAAALVEAGKTPILIKRLLEPSDIKTIDLVGGICTKEGDANVVSHAVVIARGKNKPCVTGVHSMSLIGKEIVDFGGTSLAYGDRINLDAYTGQINYGHLRLIQNRDNSILERIAKLTKTNERKIYLPLVRGLEDLIFQDPSQDIFYLVQNPNEILDQEELKEAVKGDKEKVGRLKRIWFEEVNEALHELKGHKGRIFLGTMEPDMLRRYLPNRRLLEGRRSLLEREVDDKLIVEKGIVTIGDKIKYKDDGKIYIFHGKCSYGHIVLKDIGCHSEGSNYTLPDGTPIKSFLDEDSSKEKKFLKEKAEQVEKQLVELEKTRPSRITRLQRTIIDDSAKKHLREVIIAPYSPKNSLFPFNGKVYSVLPREEILLMRIKDVLESMQQ